MSNEATSTQPMTAVVRRRIKTGSEARLFTQGSSWFSSEEGRKGTIAAGQPADLSVLSADYFSVPDEQIKHLESVLTVVGGKIVYGAAEFSSFSPPLPPISSDWSPVRYYGRYHNAKTSAPAVTGNAGQKCVRHQNAREPFALWPGSTGCDCFAF